MQAKPETVPFCWTVLAALLLATGCGKTAGQWQSGDQFLRDVAVVDVVASAIRPDRTIVIRDQRIHAILDSSDIRIPADAAVVHQGGYVMPGLWDMHVHALGDPDDALNQVLPLFIANGVTGVRDMGSVLPGVLATRAVLDDDESLPAPRLIVSGPILDGVKLPWYGDLPLVLEGSADVDRELPRLLEQGMDFFKVYDKLGDEAFRAVIAFAKERNLNVAGHAPASVGMLGAAKAGQATIEHLSVFALRECVADPDGWFNRSINAKFSGDYGNYYRTISDFFSELDQARCDEAYAAMNTAGTAFTPTLVMEFNDRSRIDEASLEYLPAAAAEYCDQLLTTIDAASAESRDAAYAAFTQQLGEIRDAGVTILAGSDTPNNCIVAGDSLHWELRLMVEAGLSPAEALRAATTDAAAMVGLASSSGKVDATFAADLLVLTANPLDDIRNTQSIAGVMRDGRWYGSEDIATLREQALATANSDAGN